MTPGEIWHLQYGGGDWERVRCLVPYGYSVVAGVLGVFLRLRDNVRLIVLRSGKVVEAGA